jgi:photosystem II stability/assembly factor-like uncharacterized protein
MKRGTAFLLVSAAYAQTWMAQTSGTTASLRGVSAVNDRVVWASGTGGIYLVTIDGGATWKAAVVPGAEQLDFRDVHALDARTAWLLSSGTGDKARIYKTGDGGAHWQLQFTNPDAKGFFDAFAFWNARNAIVVGDPVDGHFVVLTTRDGGKHWERRQTPAALPNEGAFAASGTCVATAGTREAWFGTGGAASARVFHTTDGGATWNVADTPLRHDGASAGIFSLAFSDGHYGVAVGGDYNKPEEKVHNFAITTDGGMTWTEPRGTPPEGFRSAVAWVSVRGEWIAVGTSGSDVSRDGGRTWRRFDTGAFNAMDFAPSGAGWAVGPKGRVARAAASAGRTPPK